MLGLIGKKLGMTQVFTAAGELVPVTVIQAGPCTVVQTKALTAMATRRSKSASVRRRRNAPGRPTARTA